jgi:hypothetical protein
MNLYKKKETFMDEILNKLLESELLSEETKAQITEQFGSAVTSMKEELALEVRAELVERYTKDREALVESVDTLVTAMLRDELTELKEDIASFRDLEVEFAARLISEKKVLAEQLGTELDQVVDKLDLFLEARIEEEMSELKDDLVIVKENQFGRKIFDSFMSEFNRSFVDEESLFNKIAVLEDKLSDAEDRLFESEQSEQKANRTKKLDEVLAPLSGVKREQMSMILQNVETRKLQEAYNRFVGRILKEEAKPETTQSLTESTKKQSVVKTGDTLVEEVKETKADSAKDLATIRMLSLAGLKAN